MSAAGAVEQMANAVLYEGFLLYPYRLSSVKNRHRWNFGVLYPTPFGSREGEREWVQTECLLLAEPTTTVDVKVRFLQLSGESAVEREIVLTELGLEQPRAVPFTGDGVSAAVEVRARCAGGQSVILTVKVSNLGACEGTDRDEALSQSLISTHVILRATDGRFISLIDPPAEFAQAAAQCHNTGLWPVLADANESQVLAAPIILYDHPRIAPQSPGDLFDGTEIDEILTLRIQTLTENEKRELRTGDPRGRALLERSEALTREEMSRLHAVMQPGATFQRGDRVRLRPRRRADIFDIALAGKTATVVSIEQDFEDGTHFCVTIDDDPGRDLGSEGKPGHRFFFGADELEPA